MAEPLIRFEGVAFGYDHEAPLFRDVDLDIDAGGFYLVSGPSGSGKSTFLRLLNRLEEPRSGVIRFRGRPVNQIRPERLRRRILFIPQTPAVVDGSVKYNLLLPFRFKSNQDLDPPADDRLLSMMAEFYLNDVDLSVNAQSLSVGQKQRLCFIRGLLLSPEALLLDEPTSALDDQSARVVEERILGLRGRGLTVLMVSHRPVSPTCGAPTVLAVGGGTVEEQAWTGRSSN
jgi:putative ABC transport system ATP-binding protein